MSTAKSPPIFNPIIPSIIKIISLKVLFFFSSFTSISTIFFWLSFWAINIVYKINIQNSINKTADSPLDIFAFVLQKIINIKVEAKHIGISYNLVSF